MERSDLHGAQRVRIADLGERLAALRLTDPRAVDRMQQSLARAGQLTPIVVLDGIDGTTPMAPELELVDGFKRVAAARALGWEELRVERLDAGTLIEAKLALAVLHERRGLCELEEAWLVRSLHRDDGVALPEIARQLGRHRSWAWRRMMLAESLDAAVQGQVRLGLLAPRAAVEVSRLPRGNQLPAAHVITRTGLTVRQTELLVAELLACGDDETRRRLLEQRFDAPPVRGPAPGPRARSPTEWLIADLTTLGRVVPRVEARLLDGTLVTLEEPAADLARTALDRLGRSLSALSEVITAVLEKEPKELSA